LEYKKLANTNIMVSRLGFGCWAIGGHGYGNVDDYESEKAITKALDCGINFFDTADVYGFGHSEEVLSKALGSKRHDVIIASKGSVRWDESGRVRKDCTPEYLMRAVEGSLKRLRLDFIPLYYIHWPDDQTPISDTIGTLVRLKEDGKIGAIGVSNFSPVQLIEAMHHATVSAVQVQFNMLWRMKANELIPLCNHHSMVLVAWGALGHGLLTGKFTKYSTFSLEDHRNRLPDFQGGEFIKNLDTVDKLRVIANFRGVSLSQLSLRWILDKVDCSCALFGAKTEGQVMENLGPIDWKLTLKELGDIDKVTGK